MNTVRHSCCARGDRNGGREGSAGGPSVKVGVAAGARVGSAAHLVRWTPSSAASLQIFSQMFPETSCSCTRTFSTCPRARQSQSAAPDRTDRERTEPTAPSLLACDVLTFNGSTSADYFACLLPVRALCALYPGEIRVGQRLDFELLAGGAGPLALR